jgi:DNA-binding transcriptional regulator GbsR (MarR family)
MKLVEAKAKYIQTWGTLATSWGINRTMAQIHALLLVAPEALSSEEIQTELQISSGNANLNIRALIEWGIVEKILVPGERKEFFVAKKDIWDVFKQIAKERKKREIEPVISLLHELRKVDEKSPEAKEFTKVLQDIEEVTKKANDTMDLFIKSDSHWLIGKLISLFGMKK